MILSFIFIPLLFFICGIKSQDQLKAFRPCFERYSNHRLVNLKPFHSEWRMKTEEKCLQFCADTSSRCRSVVYDTVQHICHFFLDEGDDQTIPAAKMIYFRVVSRECLVNTISLIESQGDLSALQVDSPPVTSSEHLLQYDTETERPLVETERPLVETEQPVIEEPTTQEIPTTQRKEFSSTENDLDSLDADVISPNIDKEMNGVLGDYGREQEKIDRNEIMRDIDTFGEQDKRWQTSMEILKKDDDGMIFKGTRTTANREHLKNTMMETKHIKPKASKKKENNNGKNELAEKIKDKLDKLKEMYPERYVEFISSKEVKSAIEEVMPEMNREIQNEKKTEEKEEEEEEEVDNDENEKVELVKVEKKNYKPTHIPVWKAVKSGAKVIKFSEDLMYPRKNSRFESDVRRKPTRPQLKQIFATESPYVNKARSFLQSLNGNMEEIPPLTTQPSFSIEKDNECEGDESPVWIAFQQSIPDNQTPIDSNSAINLEDCKQQCHQQHCRSFTFFTRQSQCMLNFDNDAIALKPTGSGKLSAITSTKFCYSESFSILKGCSDFIGYIDYSLQVLPREQFDGLPSGYDGMQLCIELCVLSTEYTCRSASFLSNEGRCLLNDVDSISNPNHFQPSLSSSHLYFENGCSSQSELSNKEEEALSAVRIPITSKKSPLKLLQIKPVKSPMKSFSIKRRPVNIEDYKMRSKDEIVKGLLRVL